MNSQLNRALSSLLHTLTSVRCTGLDSRGSHFWAGFGKAQGQLRALEDLGLITSAQFYRLTDLLMNGAEHAGKPFPSVRNVGPAMPAWIAYERRQPTVKPLAQVPANEPESVSAPAPCTGLRLLCLLVKARNGQARALPVHTLRPMPPRVGPVGRWSLASDPAFVLREAHAFRPTAEVLERCARHRKANAFRAAPRTVRTGGVAA